MNFSRSVTDFEVAQSQALAVTSAECVSRVKFQLCAGSVRGGAAVVTASEGGELGSGDSATLHVIEPPLSAGCASPWSSRGEARLACGNHCVTIPSGKSTRTLAYPAASGPPG